MQNNSDFARLDQLIFHTQEDAQLQGNIELEKDQSDIARIISISASHSIPRSKCSVHKVSNSRRDIILPSAPSR